MPEIGKWETTTQLTVLTGKITTPDGQRLRLVPGGAAYTQIGDVGYSNRGLNANDDLFVSKKLEVDGEAWFDYFLNATYAFGAWDNVPVLFGLGREARIQWSTVQTYDSLLIGVKCGSTVGSGNIIFCDAGDYNANFGHPISTNPTLYVQSANAAAPEQHLKFCHDGTHGRIYCGSGRLFLTSETSHVCLSAAGGVVYAHHSGVNSVFRAYHSGGVEFTEISHDGSYGKISTNADPLWIRAVAGVDIQETRGYGMRIPTSVPASPVAGSMYFDPATNVLYCHNGTAWVGVTLT